VGTYQAIDITNGVRLDRALSTTVVAMVLPDWPVAHTGTCAGAYMSVCQYCMARYEALSDFGMVPAAIFPQTTCDDVIDLPVSGQPGTFGVRIIIIGLSPATNVA
jgi:hypothetical protein